MPMLPNTAIRQMNVVSVPQSRRMLRSPRHPFYIRHKPFALQPFLLAPVLPGETMKSALIQSRVVSEVLEGSLATSISGWWCEYYLFYVKHRDLDDREEFENMMLDPTWTDDPVDETSANAAYYFSGAGINWSKLCLKRVVEEYFRDEGDAWDAHTVDGLPMASLVGNSWLDSADLTADFVQDDVDVDLNADDTITTSEIDRAFTQWMMLRNNNLTQMSYEDFLATYGVKPNVEELHRPELLRYIRDWTYPTNTVEPTTGVPSAAVNWSIAERADKDRFFREPGFIFGVACVRPKMLFSTTSQSGSAAWAMRDARSWLPALLNDGNPTNSIVFIPEGQGPLAPLSLTGTNGYFFDLRDLLIYGDQFIGIPAGTTFTAGSAGATVPADVQGWEYPTEAQIDTLFKTDTKEYIRHNGMVDLHILGTQEDRT